MKGFTLLELIIVVIIIGVLAAIAMPQFIMMTEKARGAEAMTAFQAVKTAEEAQRSSTGSYIASTQAGLLSNIGIALSGTNWTYDVAANADVSFTLTATRVGGIYDGRNIIFTYLNSSLAVTGNFPYGGPSGGASGPPAPPHPSPSEP